MSDWADRTRILDGASSSMPGPWRTARTPYLREIMDSFRDRRLKKIVLCFGTQLGKSETILNLIGYVIDQDELYAINSMNINGTVLVPKGFPKTAALIEKLGYPIKLMDTNEFRLIDGSLTCLSLRF